MSWNPELGLVDFVPDGRPCVCLHGKNTKHISATKQILHKFLSSSSLFLISNFSNSLFLASNFSIIFSMVGQISFLNLLFSCSTFSKYCRTSNGIYSFSSLGTFSAKDVAPNNGDLAFSTLFRELDSDSIFASNPENLPIISSFCASFVLQLFWVSFLFSCFF